MAKEAATSTDFMNSLPTVTMCNGLLDEPAFCTICIDDIKLLDTISKLPCSHIFHNKCILEALYHTNMCPNCRREFPKPVADRPMPQAIMIPRYRLDDADDLMDTMAQMLIGRARNLPHAHRLMRERLANILLSRTGNRSYRGWSHIGSRRFNRTY